MCWGSKSGPLWHSESPARPHWTRQDIIFMRRANVPQLAPTSNPNLTCTSTASLYPKRADWFPRCPTRWNSCWRTSQCTPGGVWRYGNNIGNFWISEHWRIWVWISISRKVMRRARNDCEIGSAFKVKFTKNHQNFLDAILDSVPELLGLNSPKIIKLKSPKITRTAY